MLENIYGMMNNAIERNGDKILKREDLFNIP